MWNDVMDYARARDLLLARVSPVDRERVPLADCAGRVLAEALTAAEDVPPFDRSPYDGYALRAADTAGIDAEHPVTLDILEEVPAGHVGRCAVTPGAAVKVLTGSPLPEGADAIVPFEDTRFTESAVTLFRPMAPGSNVIRAGEDVKAGSLLAAAGTVIDGGLAATLAGQNVARPRVFRVPRVGVVSTGSELVEPGQPLSPGKIYNTGRYALAAALQRDGAEPVFVGCAGDDVNAIAALIRDGLSRCDALVLRGGLRPDARRHGTLRRRAAVPRRGDEAGHGVLLRHGGREARDGAIRQSRQRDDELLCNRPARDEEAVRPGGSPAPCDRIDAGGAL